jgi:D-alanyl-D-alanine carboxypeptidase
MSIQRQTRGVALVWVALALLVGVLGGGRDGWTQQPPVSQMADDGPCGDGHPRAPTFDAETVRALTAIVQVGRLAGENPGMVVGIWVPGQGCYVRGFGTGNLETNAPIGVDDRFRIASITKTFTATAILQLIDQGRLTLDARLSQFVEGIAYGDRITVEELLNMTAGVYSYTDDQTFLRNYEQNPLLPFTPQDAINIIQQHDPAFEPGTQAQYSDSNYILLGLIAERVTGRPLDQVIQTQILDPLQMAHTSFPTTPDMPVPFAHGYYPNPGGSPRDVTESNPTVAWAAGAMISTLGDLRIWAKALATGTLLRPSTQALRLHTVLLSSGGGIQVRYGLGIGDLNGFLGHNGAIIGYGSDMFYLPSRNATIIVLGNLNTGNSTATDDIFAGLAFYLFPTQFPDGL